MTAPTSTDRIRAWFAARPADLRDWCGLYRVRTLDALMAALSDEDRDYLEVISSCP